MSANCEETKGAGGAGSVRTEQAPRLTPGGYAAWKRAMDVFLDRTGADGVHTEVMAEADWIDLSAQVRTWARDKVVAARALLGRAPSATQPQQASASPQPPAKQAAISDAEKEARKELTALVDRSRRVFGVLHASLPAELQTQAESLSSGWAYGLWNWLERKFQNTEADNVGNLLKQWTQLRQSDDELFDAYKARVDHVAALLAHAKEKQSPAMYGHVLLDKLLARYDVVVEVIKASEQWKDLAAISWDWVSSRINTTERNQDGREAGSDGTSDGKAMAMRAGDTSYAKVAGRDRGQRQDTRHRDGSGQGDQRPDRKPRSVTDIQCWNCEGFGHIAMRCPQPDRREDQRDGSAPGASSSSASGAPTGQGASAAVSGGRNNRGHWASRGGGTQRVQALVRNRYDTLGNDADTDREEETAHSEVDWSGSDDESIVDGKDWAGTFAAIRMDSVEDSLDSDLDTQVCATAHAADVLSKHSWGVDTMASIHVSGNRHLFRSLRKCQPIPVEMADGRTVTVMQKGSVTLRIHTADGRPITIVVDDVYHHASLPYNLLSMLELRSKGWEMHITSDEVNVATPAGDRIILGTVGRVSVIQTHPDPQDRVFSLGYTSGTISDTDHQGIRNLVRLHERLGHMSFDRMVTALKAETTLDLGKLGLSGSALVEARRCILECEACTMGKGHRTAFGHGGLDKGSAKGETLHMDLYHITKKLPDGRKARQYGLTVMDPYSEHHWIKRLLTKDQASEAVIAIVRNAQTQFGCKVKRLYADGGSEFINQTVKAFCSEQGIELHYPPAATQQLNGVAERSVRTNKEMARTMMQHADTPLQFWWRAAEHAAYVWNRTTVAKATGMTPFEAMYGRKPSARYWGVFGCDAFCHVPKEQRGAFAAKMDPCIYLGHDEVQNCAMVYVLGKDKIIASRDVEYRDSSFVHGRALRSGDQAVQDILMQGYSAESGSGPIDQHGDGIEASPQGGKDSSGAGSSGAAAPLSGISIQGGIQGSSSSSAVQRPIRRVRMQELDSSDDSESDDDGRYEVERIVGRRTVEGRTEYQVKWKGYPIEEATWQSQADVQGAEEMVAEYEDSLGLDQIPIQPAPAEPAVPAPAAAVAAPAPQAERVSRRLRGFDPEGHPARLQMVMAAIRAVTVQSDAMDGQSLGGSISESGDDTEILAAIQAGVGILDQHTPQTYGAAVSSSDASEWIAAMDREMDSCADKGTWEYLDRADVPKGKTILPCKWVYKIKTDENGAITTYKARITPKGFKQKYGEDYFEVFAATGMYKSMRAGLSLTAKFDHELEQMDVPTAFLNADIEEEVYMEIPEGYGKGKENQVCKLYKSLYGLKQAPRNWYLMISKFITQTLGFKACVSDPCLFHRRSRTGRLMLIFMFVDDFQISFHREDREEWNGLKDQLIDRFETKDMGESKWILGMRITRDRKAGTITLDQELYITKALERYGLVECRAASTPEAVGQDTIGSGSDDALDAPCDRTLYMEKTGTIMYGSYGARLDTQHIANILCCHMQAPTRRHMMWADRVLRYWSGARDIGLVFGRYNGSVVGDSRGRRGQVQVDVCAYADADWANSRVDRRSITGWVAKLNGDPISWASKKQRTVALSTGEAELYAESAAIQEVLWIRGLLKELGLYSQMGSVVHGDNQAAIAITKNGIKGERTKHVDIKYHFVTETVERGDVELKWVPTTEQQADIFTKALAAPVFEHFRKQLMTR